MRVPWWQGRRAEGGTPVADVVFVLLTIVAFAVLGLAVRAVERL
ncbi:hypothetical protein [Dactylosporangium sp. NPDC051484]